MNIIGHLIVQEYKLMLEEILIQDHLVRVLTVAQIQMQLTIILMHFLRDRDQ